MNQKMLLKGFKKPKSISYDKEEQKPNYGKFVIYPFERGFGHTIGNTLRRVLLSSLPGYAISAMRIETYSDDGGVKVLASEFEPIPEVKEETLEIVNNLKSVKLRLLEDIESKTIRIEKKGFCELKAEDLATDDTIEIINKDLHILTLSDKGHIVVEFQIDLSRGYVDVERQNENIEDINAIPIDAMFSPIEKVQYGVTNARVGQRSDYDKLTFEVWTNGTIRPEDAMAGGAKILKEYFQLFINFQEEVEEEEKEFDDGVGEFKSLIDTPVDELELSVRASNCLRTFNIRTIGDLVSHSEEDISKIRHFGKKSLLEIKEKLAKHKLSFGMQDEVGKILNKKK